MGCDILLAGLRAAIALGVQRLLIKGDSQLMVTFSNKSYTPKDGHMATYLEEVRKLEKHFKGMELMHIPRIKNSEADEIAKRASRRQPQEAGVFEERLSKASIKQPQEVLPPSTDEALPPPPATGAPDCGPPSGARLLMTMVHQETGWVDELKDYLLKGTLLEKDPEAERVARQVKSYFILEGT